MSLAWIHPAPTSLNLRHTINISPLSQARETNCISCLRSSTRAASPHVKPVTSETSPIGAATLFSDSSVLSWTADNPRRRQPLEALYAFGRQPAWETSTAFRLPPLTVCVDPEDVDLEELRALLAATGQNCQLFPSTDAQGQVEGVDAVKLQRALKHSTIVVAIYMRGEIPGGDYMPGRGGDASGQQLASGTRQGERWMDLLQRRERQKRRLVAFGRASSDTTLTASIHDVAVAPTLQRCGLGRRVIQRILRELTRRGICDIAALSSPRLKYDLLKSTTMTYTRTPAMPLGTPPMLGTEPPPESITFGRHTLFIPPPLRVPHEPNKPLGKHKAGYPKQAPGEALEESVTDMSMSAIVATNDVLAKFLENEL